MSIRNFFQKQILNGRVSIKQILTTSNIWKVVYMFSVELYHAE